MWTGRCLWKHYLRTTTVADGKNARKFRGNTISKQEILFWKCSCLLATIYGFIFVPDICRICLNQKCVLKRHQQKVHESQMNYARIIGDKQLEDELKRKYRGEYRKWDKLRDNHWRQTTGGWTQEEVQRWVQGVGWTIRESLETNSCRMNSRGSAEVSTGSEKNHWRETAWNQA